MKPMKILLLFLGAASIAALPVVASAAPCKDAKGKFTKCPEKKAAPKRCTDAKGKFAKCGSPGAKSA
jgi:hypothetical protein